MANPKKILLIQLRQLGDIILTTPCLRELKKAWPDASIDFLCHPMGKLILKGNPYLNQLITYDLKASWIEQLRFLESLRKARYDLVLDFMYNPRSALYAAWTRAPKRLAFPSRRSFLFTDLVPQNPKVEYIVREKFRYLEYLGLRPADETLDLPWGRGDLGPLEKLLAAEPKFAQAKVRAVISATHRRDERQWPVERYAEVADRLVREKGAAVLWIWGPGEDDFVKQAMSHCREPMLMSPATTFHELAALLGNCDFFLGNSNGPSHVAVSVRMSSLQIHGPTYANAWCPRTALHRAVQAGENLPEGRAPIALIQTQEVWQTLEAMWPQIEQVAAQRQARGLKSQWMH